MSGEPIQRVGKRALHRNGIRQAMVGAFEYQKTLRMAQGGVELIGFFHRHDFVGVAVQDQYWTLNLLHRRRHVDFFQVREQRNVETQAVVNRKAAITPLLELRGG